MKTYIIDDDKISIYLTRHLLKTAGFSEDIAFFLSAEEALQTLLKNIGNHMPRVIFLDLNMPGMSGWDFLDALAPYKYQLLGQCRIYILTSSLDLADMAKSEEYELVNGFIHKTISQENIQVILAEMEKQTS